MAYAIVQRSDAISKAVETKFPESVRLSVHPKTMGSKKIGLRLGATRDDNHWRTPWHSVALQTTDTTSSFILVPRKEAEDSGATVHMKDGKYAYFAKAAPGA